MTYDLIFLFKHSNCACKILKYCHLISIFFLLSLFFYYPNLIEVSLFSKKFPNLSNWDIVLAFIFHPNLDPDDILRKKKNTWMKIFLIFNPVNFINAIFFFLHIQRYNQFYLYLGGDIRLSCFEIGQMFERKQHLMFENIRKPQ